MLGAELHPACLLFPRLSEPELHALADDIRRNGLLNPIVTLDGRILDGRNRLEACKIAGVKPRFVQWKGKGSPLDWVVATNLVRRHLTASQRAVVAFDLLPLLESEAKERQRRSPGRGRKVANELATLSETGKASQHAAKITHANSTYVERIKAVNSKAPELIPELKSGRITVNEATRLARLSSLHRTRVLTTARRLPTEPVKRIIRRVIVDSLPQPAPARMTNEGKITIWCGDCVRLMRQKIADASISIVTTSPPYNRRVHYRTYEDNLGESEYFGWLTEVFEEINRVLKGDGSFFLVVGHSPKKPWMAMQVAEIAGKFFALQNQIIWVKSISVDGHSKGHFSPIQGKRFLNRVWEYIFHFTKNGNVSLDRLALGLPYEAAVNSARTGSSHRCGGDVWFVPAPTVHGPEDRANHPATFPPELAQRCIKLAGVCSDTVVLDPFCGVNGMVAAARLGVEGIGIDIDPAYCSAARQRARAVPIA